MTVRRAKLEDAPAIARIHVATWRAAYRGILADETLAALSEEKRTAQWREWLSGGRPEITVFVAESLETRESARSIAGFASVGPSRDADAPGAHEIHAIYVDPDHWREGHGRALVLAALEGRSPVTLWVLEANVKARAFYEAMGFVLDGGRKPDRIGELDVIELRYLKA